MIIDADHPLAHRVLVYKQGEIVGCVQEIDTDAHTMRRFEASDIAEFLINGGERPVPGEPESYDYLVIMERPTHE